MVLGVKYIETESRIIVVRKGSRGSRGISLLRLVSVWEDRMSWRRTVVTAVSSVNTLNAACYTSEMSPQSPFI